MKWIEELSSFYKTLSATEKAIVISLLDHEWSDKATFLSYLKEHVQHTQSSIAFMKRWENITQRSQHIAFLMQDLNASLKLQEYLRHQKENR